MQKTGLCEFIVIFPVESGFKILPKYLESIAK